MGGARYQVTHETEYHYESSVVHAWQLVHLEPRATPWQQLLEHSLEVEPQPSEIERSFDYFGNPVSRFLVARQHDVLLVRARSLVDVAPRAPDDGTDSPSWESVCADAGRGTHAQRYELAQYLAPSPFAPLLAGAAEFGRREFTPRRPWLQALQGLARLIHGEFEFDPVATTVSTPIATLLENRRGVCQDFAHLMVSALRSLGLPARYVSGYILTTPPPGRPRLAGADASHAWVSAWCPGLGWVDADPPNAKLADLEFVTLGWGRDYRDVPPLRGVVRGGDEQRLEVRVTVEPVAP